MARKLKTAAISHLFPPVQNQTAKERSRTTNYSQETQGFGGKGRDYDDSISRPPQKKQMSHNENRLNQTNRYHLPFDAYAITPVLSRPTQYFRNATLQPARPPLEYRTSATSPPIFIAAISALKLFTSRTERLQSHITLLETRVQIAREEIPLLSPEDPLVTQIANTIRTYEEIIDLALEHLTEVFVHEHAFRDMFDETCSREEDALAVYGDKAIEEFWLMKRVYDGKLLPLLQKLNPQAMAITMRQLVGIREEVDGNDNSLASNENDNVV